MKLSHRFRVHMLDFCLVLKRMIQRDCGVQCVKSSTDIHYGGKLQSWESGVLISSWTVAEYSDFSTVP